jgi:hypothetical protein
VRKLIGRGGLSRVYLAFDPDLQRTVALKILASEHVSIEGAHAWSLQEGPHDRAAPAPGRRARVRGRRVRRRDLPGDGVVDGPSLADVLDELKRAPVRDAETSPDPRVRAAADALSGIGARARLGLSVARALAGVSTRAACCTATSSRRTCCSNPRASPKLIDFGLAHLDAAEGSLNRVTQRLVGTPASLAPEQVESGQTGASARSDQFSFGVLLYELLTLKAPFQRSTRTQTLDAVAQTMPVAPRKIEAQIPADLETICLHALERQPAERYQSMDALADDLEAFLDHRAIAMSAPSRGRKLRLWARRHRRDLLLGGIPALVLLVGLAAWQVVRARDVASAFEDEWTRESAAVGAYQDPQAIQDAFVRARDLASRSARARSGLLTRRFQPDAAAHVQTHIHAISDPHGQLIDRARDEIRGMQSDLRGEPEEELLRTWEEALVYDAVVCPDLRSEPRRPRARTHRRARRSGRDARRGGETAGAQAVDVLRARAHADVRLLLVGQYRITWSQDGGGLLAEFDLEVHRRTQRATIVLEPIPAAMRARFVHVPAGTINVPSMPKVDVPEFWVYPEWLEAERIRDGPRPSRLTVDDTLEGLVPIGSSFVYDQAAYAARGYSARLPGVSEAQRLAHLASEGKMRLDPLPAGCIGEYCCGLQGPSGRSHLRHRPETDPPYSISLILEKGTLTGGLYACRLVVLPPPCSVTGLSRCRPTHDLKTSSHHDDHHPDGAQDALHEERSPSRGRDPARRGRGLGRVARVQEHRPRDHGAGPDADPAGPS